MKHRPIREFATLKISMCCEYLHGVGRAAYSITNMDTTMWICVSHEQVMNISQIITT